MEWKNLPDTSTPLNAENLNNILKDTGWIKATLNSGYTHNALSSAGDLLYRRTNNIVYVKGSVKGFAASGDVCCSLPVGFRPITRIDAFFGTGGNYFAKGMVSANGSISLLGDTRGTYSTSNWYSICTSYITDDAFPTN